VYPQMLAVVKRFVAERVEPRAGFERRDVFLNPFFGWTVETLTENMYPDTASGEAPEIPIYEASERRSGSTADVDFWTSREVRDVVKSHINRVVADTKKWEQSAAYYLDTHENIISFAKNAGLGFAIPYLHNGEQHEYVPDYLARLRWEGKEVGTLIMETKGHDPLREVKKAAAERWVDAVNNEGSFGRWAYHVVHEPTDVKAAVREVAQALA
jgi:type III restriction enzyme